MRTQNRGHSGNQPRRSGRPAKGRGPLAQLCEGEGTSSPGKGHSSQFPGSLRFLSFPPFLSRGASNSPLLTLNPSHRSMVVGPTSPIL